ncbi:unnamed protein product [Closterium sp. NIES-53]
MNLGAMKNMKVPPGAGGAIGSVLRAAVVGGAVLYGAVHSLYNVEGGHRAIIFNRLSGIKDTVGFGVNRFSAVMDSKARSTVCPPSTALCSGLCGAGAAAVSPLFPYPLCPVPSALTSPPIICILPGCVLTRPMSDHLPTIYRTLGQDHARRVLNVPTPHLCPVSPHLSPCRFTLLCVCSLAPCPTNYHHLPHAKSGLRGAGAAVFPFLLSPLFPFLLSPLFPFLLSPLFPFLLSPLFPFLLSPLFPLCPVPHSPLPYSQVRITLCVLTRPMSDRLPTIYRTLGQDHAERVLLLSPPVPLSSADLCLSSTLPSQVRITLRVLTRPVSDRLPTIYRTLGQD